MHLHYYFHNHTFSISIIFYNSFSLIILIRMALSFALLSFFCSTLHFKNGLLTPGVICFIVHCVGAIAVQSCSVKKSSCLTVLIRLQCFLLGFEAVMGGEKLTEKVSSPLCLTLSYCQTQELKLSLEKV